MKKYSNELKERASNVKKDMETAEKFTVELTRRHHDLLQLQNCLEQQNKTINTEFSDICNESSFAQKIIKKLRLLDYKLETEDKLKYVNDEIATSLTEIEHANTDYTRISYKLNECQIELETCVGEYKQLLNAFVVVVAKGDWSTVIGASVGIAVGGFIGSAVGPFGTLLGLQFGGTAGGCCIGGLVGLLYGAQTREQKHQCKKLLDSCDFCIKEIEKNTHELQKIQDRLIKAKKSS